MSLKTPYFSIIVAYDHHQGIGYKTTMPWHLPADMAHFKRITSTTQNKDHQNLVIMGRTTWESIPQKYRPLPNRKNMIITNNPHYTAPTNVLMSSDLAHTLNTLQTLKETHAIETVFVMGGMSIYTQALTHPNCTELYITEINHTFTCDTFFPKIPPQFIQNTQTFTQDPSGVSLTFKKYTKKLS